MAMQPDNIDTTKLATIGVTGVILVLALGGIVQAMFFDESHTLDYERNVVPANRQLALYLVQENEKLHRYGWVDKTAAIVTIPIEQAMELTVRELQAARSGASAQSPNAPQQPKDKKL